MTQRSQRMARVEAVANVAAGCGVSVVTPVLIFPVFGLHTVLGIPACGPESLVIWGPPCSRPASCHAFYGRELRSDPDVYPV